MVRNILAVIVGIIAGSIVNGLLISFSGLVIPPPAGADMTTVDNINAAMPLLGPANFLFPFVAHAAGSFVGALTASLIAVSNRLAFSIAIGSLFFLGGAYMAYVIAAPLWFEALDLIFAYIPMAWLGWKVAGGKSQT